MAYFAAKYIIYHSDNRAHSHGDKQLSEYVGMPCEDRAKAHALAKRHNLPHVVYGMRKDTPPMLLSDCREVWVRPPNGAVLQRVT